MRSASIITERPLRISAHPVSIGNDDEHSATNNNDNNKHIYVRHLKTEFSQYFKETFNEQFKIDTSSRFINFFAPNKHTTC